MPCVHKGWQDAREEGERNGCLAMRGSLFSITQRQKQGLGMRGGTCVGSSCCPGIIQCPLALWHCPQVTGGCQLTLPASGEGDAVTDLAGVHLFPHPLFLGHRPGLMEQGLLMQELRPGGALSVVLLTLADSCQGELGQASFLVRPSLVGEVLEGRV